MPDKQTNKELLKKTLSLINSNVQFLFLKSHSFHSCHLIARRKHPKVLALLTDINRCETPVAADVETSSAIHQLMDGMKVGLFISRRSSRQSKVHYQLPYAVCSRVQCHKNPIK